MRIVACALIAWLLSGCGETSEFAERFDAERARWHADREEADLRAGTPSPGEATLAKIRALHASVGERYGATTAPTPAQLADPDARLRLQIAGSSSLYELDLASLAPPTAELADRYARLADVYAFDRSLWFRCRLGEASIRERLDETDAALAVYRRIVTDAGVPTRIGAGGDGQYVLDLHVHAGILALEHLPPNAAARELASLHESIAAPLAAGADTLLAPYLQECLAQICFLERKWDEGCAILDTLASSISLPARRANFILMEGEVRQYETRDLDLAEAAYREVITVMDGTPIATTARLRLAESLLRRRRPAAALDIVEETLELGASLLVDNAAEARYWKARALTDLGRWEDAIPVFHEAAELDAESPYAFLAAIERQRRLERLTRPSSREAPNLVGQADRVPANPYRRLVPKHWSDYARERRARSIWRESIEGLLDVTKNVRDVDVRENAILAAARLAEDRAGDEKWAAALRARVHR
jgi:tetratricopeptide (TPR) repeat protein